MEEWIREKFKEKFPNSDFDKIYEYYKKIPCFRIDENWFDVYTGEDKEIIEKYGEEIHYIMRLVAEYYYTKFMEALKIDLDDPNVKRTAFRITKMYTGKDLDDDTELMSGRFMRRPRLAVFPNETSSHSIVIKKIDLVSVCSHHFAPFSTRFEPGSCVVVAYKPKEFVIGLSKLTRYVRDYIGRRGWLQENLTRKIYDELSSILKTEDVYVGLFNIKHSCEWLRGAQDSNSGFTTECYGGIFKDPQVRENIINLAFKGR
jgi:GTP cyclohydrolase I